LYTSLTVIMIVADNVIVVGIRIIVSVLAVDDVGVVPGGVNCCSRENLTFLKTLT
jgi:hypothetical protein